MGRTNWEDFDYITPLQQTNVDEYFDWIKSLIDNATSFRADGSELSSYVHQVSEEKEKRVVLILSVAERWNVPWQMIRSAIDNKEIKTDFCYQYRDLNDIHSQLNIRIGIPLSEMERLEASFPILKERALSCQFSNLKEELGKSQQEKRNIQKLLVRIARFIDVNFDNCKSPLVNSDSWIQAAKSAEVFLKWYMDDIERHPKTFQEKSREIFQTSTSQEQALLKKNGQTINAQIGNLKKRVQGLTEGYNGAAKLAHIMTVEGPKQGINPWSEADILSRAEELGISLKGDCLKAFKAGMPAALVKKDAGARPITPREESPDDVES